METIQTAESRLVRAPQFRARMERLAAEDMPLFRDAAAPLFKQNPNYSYNDYCANLLLVSWVDAYGPRVRPEWVKRWPGPFPVHPNAREILMRQRMDRLRDSLYCFLPKGALHVRGKKNLVEMALEVWEGWVPDEWARLWERNPARLQSSFDCISCGINTNDLDEYYMIQNPLWKQVAQETNGRGMMCIACVEQRLGRRLKIEDFPTHIPLNNWFIGKYGHRFERSS